MVAIARGNIPAKVVLAVNDRVHQWILTRPNIASVKDLKGKQIATTGVASASEKFMKEQPNVIAGFNRATLKALRLIKRDRDGTIAAFVKFSGLPSATVTRLYDDLIGTFTANGAVDEETQKNDLAVIRQVLDTKEALAPARAFDFS